MEIIEDHNAEVETQKRRPKGDVHVKSVKIEMREPFFNWIQEAISTLKGRGQTVSPGQFVEKFLDQVTQESVQQWIELETPIEWRLNQILLDPDKANLVKKLFHLDSGKDRSVIQSIESLLDGNDKLKLPTVRKRKAVNQDSKEGSSIASESTQ